MIQFCKVKVLSGCIPFYQILTFLVTNKNSRSFENFLPHPLICVQYKFVAITKAYFAMSVCMSVSNSRPNRRFSTVSPQFQCAESESEIRFPKFNLGRPRETSEVCGFLLFFG
jgi:hypothetical protein